MPKPFDFGIAGRKAIVCGSSKGLGKACAVALAGAGVEVTINGRDQKSLAAAVQEIARIDGARVQAVAADIREEDGRKKLLAACPEPDILVNNAGGPPPGDFRQWGEAEWGGALNANMLTPIFMIRATIDAMARRKWGRIINITSGAVKAPLPLLGLSNGARAGLTGFVAGLAREVARDGVTINNLLPGYFATERLKTYVAATAEKRGETPTDAWTKLEKANPVQRLGQPEEFGAVCLFLASAQAGYINGQNILMDGGQYPGVF
jgi:3-oxoacyl-[acyl-carrier protein] reductase